MTIKVWDASVRMIASWLKDYADLASRTNYLPEGEIESIEHLADCLLDQLKRAERKSRKPSKD